MKQLFWRHDLYIELCAVGMQSYETNQVLCVIRKWRDKKVANNNKQNILQCNQLFNRFFSFSES